MVRLLNADGTERGRTLTDARGHFGFDEAACAGCTLDVALTGFQNVAMGVTVNSPATITLSVQGVEESVLVSPTNTEAPSIQTGTTTTVITADDLEHRQSLARGRRPPRRARPDGRADRRPRKPDLGVRPRRREQLHEGPARRHPAERSRRLLQLRDDLRPTTWNGSDRAGPAVGALRVGRDGGRHPALHTERRSIDRARARRGKLRGRQLQHLARPRRARRSRGHLDVSRGGRAARNRQPGTPQRVRADLRSAERRRAGWRADPPSLHRARHVGTGGHTGPDGLRAARSGRRWRSARLGGWRIGPDAP